MSVVQAIKLLIFIWIIGLLATLPWAIVFQVKFIDPETGESDNASIVSTTQLPFCIETWNTKTQEISYFLLHNVFVCFLLPLGLISVCNVVIWKNVLATHSSSCTMSSSPHSSVTTIHDASCLRDIQRQRILRVLKLFTGLTSVFFVCWLPLYLIMGRVKISYTETFHGSVFEQQLVSVLIPLGQLLGSCNSCVNPVLYALLNQKFRPKLKLWPRIPNWFRKASKRKSKGNKRHPFVEVVVKENQRNIDSTAV